MGCAASAVKTTGDMDKDKNINALKAAVLIQTWFRRHQARLEARRRCTWKIFQAIEYAGEQDHVKLCNFFNELLSSQQRYTINQHLASEDRLLDIYADPLEIELDESWSGPEIRIPLDLDTVWELVDYLQAGKVLHVRYVLLMLHEVRNKLRELPNIRNTSTSITKQITICGDLHGSFDDLMTIFEKNNAPSCANPYVFNGDLVDRGKHSIEVVLVVFSFFLLYPNHVYVNRGNHEDYVMNSRYGFFKEIAKKYKDHASKIVRVFEDVFSWLPLATVIDNEILVVHGGVSNLTTLAHVNTINRHKYRSILKPNFMESQLEKVDVEEWRQVLDLLWSDPCYSPGCTVNSYRGGGCYFGPDVTTNFLNAHGLKLLVRAHECVSEGHKFSHGGKVVTVFSASNYYEEGSNKGAYMRILPNVKPYFVEYSGSKTRRELNTAERISKGEQSALRELRKMIFSHKDVLCKEFRQRDHAKTGLITVIEWINVMETVLGLSLPWSMINKQMSVAMKDGKVDYESCLDQYYVQAMLSKKGNLVETLYRHRNTFETIFRIMDKNNSGSVSLDEFEECCEILCEHTKCLSKQDIKELALTIDMNSDGSIDFNEFLEAFRLCEAASASTS